MWSIISICLVVYLILSSLVVEDTEQSSYLVLVINWFRIAVLTVGTCSGPPEPIIAETITNPGPSAEPSRQLNRSNSLGANQRGGGESQLEADC